MKSNYKEKQPTSTGHWVTTAVRSADLELGAVYNVIVQKGEEAIVELRDGAETIMAAVAKWRPATELDRAIRPYGN